MQRLDVLLRSARCIFDCRRERRVVEDPDKFHYLGRAQVLLFSGSRVELYERAAVRF
jgi:hypothetical protein